MIRCKTNWLPLPAILGFVRCMWLSRKSTISNLVLVNLKGCISWCASWETNHQSIAALFPQGLNSGFSHFRHSPKSIISTDVYFKLSSCVMFNRIFGEYFSHILSAWLCSHDLSRFNKKTANCFWDFALSKVEYLTVSKIPQKSLRIECKKKTSFEF